MTKKEVLKAIRAKCLDCCCDQAEEVRLCPAKDCSLHTLRMGKDPTPRVLSPAQLENLNKMRLHRDEITQKQGDKDNGE